MLKEMISVLKDKETMIEGLIFTLSIASVFVVGIIIEQLIKGGI